MLLTGAQERCNQVPEDYCVVGGLTPATESTTALCHPHLNT